jgi:hypothetical protein
MEIMGDSLLCARGLRHWNEIQDGHAGFILKINVSGNPRRLQQFEKECAPRLHGWTCDQSVAQIQALNLATIGIVWGLVYLWFFIAPRTDLAVVRGSRVHSAFGGMASE